MPARLSHRRSDLLPRIFSVSLSSTADIKTAHDKRLDRIPPPVKPVYLKAVMKPIDRLNEEE